jgi:hypothetical protein
MRRFRTIGCLLAFAVAGCATNNEMKMVPAADSATGVRFSRGEAWMLSAGERGAVTLRPFRYNGSSGKVIFLIAAYNHAGEPINFGPEDVTIHLDNGVPVAVEDFDSLRHNAKVQADYDRAAALITAAVVEIGAAQVSRRDPNRAQRIRQANMDHLDDRFRSIAYNLEHFVEGAYFAVLQTSTVDPETYFRGGIIAEQPVLAVAEVRRMEVTVRFAGEPHHFSLLLAHEGTPTPTGDLPAVSHPDLEKIGRTPQTWLFTDPPAPPPAPPVPVIYTVTRW